MTNSEKLFDQAQNFIPGGVNSPVRAFRGVGGDPVFFKAGKGGSLCLLVLINRQNTAAANPSPCPIK